MSDMKTIDAALLRLAKAHHAEAGYSAHIIGQAQTMRQNMIVAARILRKRQAALISQGVTDEQLERVNAEYTKSVQTRALMDNVLGVAFVVNARLGKGATNSNERDDDGTVDGGNDGRGPASAPPLGAARPHGRGRFRAS